MVEKLIDAKNHAHKTYDLVAAKLGCDSTKDARVLLFKYTAETIQAYYFAVSLSMWFPTLEIFTRLPESEQKSGIRNAWSSYLEEMKVALLGSFFVNMELCLRVIAESFIPVNPQTPFKQVVEKLLNTGGIADETLDLLLIVIYTRNTFHYSGIATKETVTLNYKGNSYKFEKDLPVNFLDFNGILYLINEVIAALQIVMLTSPIKDAALITHPSSNFFKPPQDV